MAEYGRYGLERAPDETDPVRKAFNENLGNYPKTAGPIEGPSQAHGPGNAEVLRRIQASDSQGLVDPVPGLAEMAAKYTMGRGMPTALKAIGAIPSNEGRIETGYKGAPVTDTGLTLRGPQAERNATKIADMMRKMVPAGTTPTDAENAILYMRAKYPLLTSKLVGRIATTDEIPFRGRRGRDGTPSVDSLSGQHQKDMFDIGTPAGKEPNWVSENRIAIKQGRGDWDSVGTLGHELTHAIQDARWKRSPLKPQFTDDVVRAVKSVEGTTAGTPIRVPKRSISGPGFARTTNPHGPFVGTEEIPSQYRRANDLYGYENNPFETQAQAGGATAQDTMRNFAKAYKPAPQVTGYKTAPVRTPRPLAQDAAFNNPYDPMP